MATLDIGKEFSVDPLGRFRGDGNASGEAFREDFLLPRLRTLAEGETLTLILDNGVESYGSSFLTEGFAGVIKYGYMRADTLLSRLEFKFENPEFAFYRDKIILYCQQAKHGVTKYTPTRLS